MATSARLVLDFLEPLTVSAERRPGVQNLTATLDRLLGGMEFLYEQIRRKEEAVHAEARRQGRELQGAWGGVDDLAPSGLDQDTICCAFDWYAINACRFFKLLAFVSDEKINKKDEVNEYQRRVCGSVLKYRHKIAAHYALTDPRDEDNPADRYQSTMDTTMYRAGRLRVGGVRFGLVTPTEMIEPQHEYEWSLTEFHESVVVPRRSPPKAPAASSSGPPS